VYLPAHFQESRPDVLRDFVTRHPLATLVANTAQGLTANYLPMLWLPGPEGNGEALSEGVLRGHIARANALWRQVEQGAQVLTLFSGAQHYISPNWYPSKHVDGRVVPTWNYATVQIHGTVRFIEDTVWLRALVEELTRIHERSQPVAWKPADAPLDYIEKMLHAIVGVEIGVTRVEGKFKGSQNRAMEDRERVATALRTEGVAAASLSELVPGSAP
jgi:transcriptional regulator